MSNRRRKPAPSGIRIYNRLLLHPASLSPDSAYHRSHCTIKAMTPSDKVFIPALLLMAMLSISHRGVSAQNRGCKVALDACVLVVSSDNASACKGGMSCINNVPTCTKEEKEEAKRKLIEKGCSGSGMPIISAMSLFVAALFNML
uniref:Uncharacterized protein n=1 Tax=Magallana gigas TaxID=29159 RepID=A0A8W8KN06_MAGGI